VYFAVFLKNFISAAVILDISCSIMVHISLPCNQVGTASVLCIHNLVCFWMLEGFRTLLMVPVICKNFDNLFGTSFFFNVTVSIILDIKHQFFYHELEVREYVLDFLHSNTNCSENSLLCIRKTLLIRKKH
jgi:hypothetical protein